MRYLFAAPVLAMTLLLVPQDKPRVFDVVPYLGTLNIYRAWSVDAFPIPSYATRSFIDSLRSNDELVGFTLRLRSNDSTGWSAWLDFDADRLRAMRLRRVFAQKPMHGPPVVSFGQLTAEIDSLLGKRIMDRTAQGDTLVSWRWIPRDGYRLTARTVTSRADSARYLTITLDRR